MDTEIATTSKDSGTLVSENSLLEDLETFTQAGYKKVQQGVVASHMLPDKDDYKLYSTYPKFLDIMKKEGANILDAIQIVLDYAKITGRISEHSEEEKGDLILEGNDMLLDRSTMNMDILEGFREPAGFSADSGYHKKLSGSWNKVPAPSTSSVGSKASEQQNGMEIDKASETGTVTLHVAKITTRPQIYFKDKINNQNEPWEPRIKEKPNNLKPLAILLEVNEDGYESYSHPYEYELERWEPPEEQMERIKIAKPKSIQDTPYMFVESQEDLNTLMSELENHKLIAVDLEHHSYRSFMGFTCLMQMSTIDKDYVIDTLALRDKLYVLNEIFTKPTVLKVFHGASNDIEWLQRDLSLYVVNMFDTFHAAKVLQLPKLNLAYLLKKYFDIAADKHFQLYDWRSRPLSEKAIKYAREDTHYLLYIYAQLSNKLLEKGNGNTNLLKSVYQQSTETCKRKYTKPLLEEDSHMLLYRKTKRLFDNKQLYALKELHTWRDTIARQEDESIGYVLPNHMLLQIAENLPREMQGILACCNPIPPLVRQHVLELHNIILKARSQPLVKAIQEHRVVTHTADSNLGSGTGRTARLFDLSHGDFRDDLPTVCNGTLVVDELQTDNGLIKEASEPFFPLPCEDSDNTTHSKKVMKSLNDIENKKLLNPYQRYKLILPYINQMEKEQREREEKEHRLKEQKRMEEENERRRLVYDKNVVSLKNDEQIVEDLPLSKRKRRHNKTAAEVVGETSSNPQQVPEEKTEKSPAKQKGHNNNKLMKLEEEPTASTQNQSEDEETGEVGIINAEINTRPWSTIPEKRYQNVKPYQVPNNFTPFDYMNTNFNKFNIGGNRNHQQRRQQHQQGQKNKNFPDNKNRQKNNNKPFGLKKNVTFKKRGGGGGNPR